MKRLTTRLRAVRARWAGGRVLRTRWAGWRGDAGASAVEYGLLVALIAVVIAGTVILLGDALNQKLKDACATVQDGTAGGDCD